MSIYLSTCRKTHRRRLPALPTLGAAIGLLLAGPAVFAQSTMPGMDHGSMPGMNHGAMPGMDHGSGNTQSNAPAVTPAPAEQPPSRAPAPSHEAHPSRSSPASGMPAPPGAGRSIPGDPSYGTTPMPTHGNHNVATPSQQQMLRSSTVPSASQYKRNPDGSYQIPGSEMVMADNDIFYMVLLDQLEYVKRRNSNGIAWDAEGWVGRDYGRLWLKTEGERIEGRSEGSIEALYSKPIAAFWDAQVGVRHDFGEGPSRQWLALAIQGIAPYWFDVEGALYLGSAGRVGARFKTDYSFRLSQTAFLTPEVEVNAYNKSDRARGIGSGLSDIQFGLRLRYELRREVAPYIGVTWGRKLGRTADFAREEGESPIERQVVAGVRIWF